MLWPSLALLTPNRSEQRGLQARLRGVLAYPSPYGVWARSALPDLRMMRQLAEDRETMRLFRRRVEEKRELPETCTCANARHVGYSSGAANVGPISRTAVLYCARGVTGCLEEEESCLTRWAANRAPRAAVATTLWV